MSVPVQTPVVNYNGNGATTAFAVPFIFENQTDLLVTLYTAGVPTVQVYNSNYTVTGGDVGAGPATGTVTFGAAPATGTTIYIENAPKLQQQATLTETGTAPALTITNVWDYLQLQIQWLQQQISQCIMFPIDYTVQGFNPDIPEGSAAGVNAGQILQVNPGGTGWQWASPTTVAADLPDNTFTIPNNQVAPLAVTGMSFSTALYRSAIFEYDIQIYDTLGLEWRATGRIKAQYNKVAGTVGFEDDFDGPTPTAEQTGVAWTATVGAGVVQMNLTTNNKAITGVYVGKLNFKVRTFNA